MQISRVARFYSRVSTCRNPPVCGGDDGDDDGGGGGENAGFSAGGVRCESESAAPDAGVEGEGGVESERVESERGESASFRGGGRSSMDSGIGVNSADIPVSLPFSLALFAATGGGDDGDDGDDGADWSGAAAAAGAAAVAAG